MFVNAHRSTPAGKEDKLLSEVGVNSSQNELLHFPDWKGFSIFNLAPEVNLRNGVKIRGSEPFIKPLSKLLLAGL